METVQGVRWTATWVDPDTVSTLQKFLSPPSPLNTEVQFPGRSDRSLGITLIYPDFGIEKGTCPGGMRGTYFHAFYTFQI